MEAVIEEITFWNNGYSGLWRGSGAININFIHACMHHACNLVDCFIPHWVARLHIQLAREDMYPFPLVSITKNMESL